MTGSTSRDVRRRVAGYDWRQIADDLDQRGWARLPRLVADGECAALAAEWRRPERFRSRVDMAQHRFGAGEYRYFADPLPPLVRSLRTHLYPRLASIANDWQARLGRGQGYPRRWSELRERCRRHGQERPTPLLLRYEAGGYNCLHRDVYGPVAFPLQVVCLLSPASQFDGGELLLVEQRPRAQSRGEAIRLSRGEAVVFPNGERPVRGSRGFYRASVRHGVSPVHRGRRTTLGIIFHQAR